MLPHEIVETHATPDSCVIWMHGLGADGHDFVPLVPELHLPDHLRLRFIFPHAPMIPVSINNGYVMPAWYDIYSPTFLDQQDAAGIRQSQQQLIPFIEQQIASGIAAKRIIIAGFSQGGAIALHTALRYPETLGGILALSTYLPLSDSLATEAHHANNKTAIMMAHGTSDPVISISLAEQSRTLLEKHDYPVAWHQYAMEHSLCPDEISDISAWIQQQLSFDNE